MNSLQIGLIGIGVFVIAVLALWSWWQQRQSSADRARPSAAKPANDAHREPSIRSDRAELIEPVVNVSAATVDELSRVTPTAQLATSEPAFESTEGKTWFPPSSRLTTDEPAAAADPQDAQHEATSALRTEPSARNAPMVGSVASPVGAVLAPPSVAPVPSIMPFDERLHVYAVLTRDDGQPFDVMPFLRIAGRASVWGRLFRQSPWEGIDLSQPTGAVISLCLALPIASRGGPVTASEFDAWRTAVAVECANQNVSAQFEGFTAAAARAEELDSFLAAVDCIPITYLVRKDGEAWSGTRLRGTLEANGFRLQSDGRFAYHEVETEQVIFYAVDGYERAFTPERLRTESVAAFRLVMEAALLTQPLHRFDAYRQTLRALAKLMDAELRDSSGAAVGEPEFAALRAQVQSASEALTAAGIAPGSPSAIALLA